MNNFLSCDVQLFEPDLLANLEQSFWRPVLFICLIRSNMIRSESDYTIVCMLSLAVNV